MKTPLKFFLVAAAVALASCTSDSSQKQNDTVTKQLTTDSAEEPEHDHNIAIVLNNGNKWKVDDHMMAHIRNMESRVNSTTETDNQAALAEFLKVQIDSLTSGCTMKGQAHDELHKWLLPYIELVDAFASAKQPEQQSLLADLQNAFVEFNRYFE